MTKKTAITRLEQKTFRARLQAAVGRADEIVQVAHITEPPVDPLVLAASEAPLLRACGDNFRNKFDGQLEYHKARRRFLLLYNTKYDVGLLPGEHHPRTRFSIAHELAHFYLDEHHTFLRGGGKSHASCGEFEVGVKMEREADAFASGMLLPTKLFQPLVNEDDLTLSRIDDFAALFRTSLVSTAIRAAQVSHFPTAFVGIRGGQVAWTSLAPCLVENGCYPPERGPLESPTARDEWASYRAGNTVRTQHRAFAKHWFRTYGNERLEQLPVTEQFLPAPVMNTLLVLLTIPEEELYEELD